MISISAIKAKFKRSGINFKKTFLFEEKPFLDEDSLSFIHANEKCIIYYKDSNNYNWFLTDKRFIVPSENKVFFLKDLKKIDISNIKSNPEKKTENNELTLFTLDDKFVFFVEEKSWHLFYNIFKFIIENKDNITR
jgi:hypothetical protein